MSIFTHTSITCFPTYIFIDLFKESDGLIVLYSSISNIVETGTDRIMMLLGLD